MSVKLDKMDVKLLHALCRYNYSDIGLQELNGYFRFPPIERILESICRLEQAKLIQKKEPPFHGYMATEKGKQYLKKHKLSLKKVFPSWKKIVFFAIDAAISALIGALLSHFLWP